MRTRLTQEGIEYIVDKTCWPHLYDLRRTHIFTPIVFELAVDSETFFLRIPKNCTHCSAGIPWSCSSCTSVTLYLVGPSSCSYVAILGFRGGQRSVRSLHRSVCEWLSLSPNVILFRTIRDATACTFLSGPIEDDTAVFVVTMAFISDAAIFGVKNASTCSGFCTENVAVVVSFLQTHWLGRYHYFLKLFFLPLEYADSPVEIQYQTRNMKWGDMKARLRFKGKYDIRELLPWN